MGGNQNQRQFLTYMKNPQNSTVQPISRQYESNSITAAFPGANQAISQSGNDNNKMIT